MGKLRKIHTRISNCRIDIKAFGLFVGLTNMMWPVIVHFPNGIRNIILRKKEQIVYSCIQKYCSEVIKKYQNEELHPSLSNISWKAPVFVCWLQGENNAPLVVKRCVESIRKHIGSHPLYFVSADNYTEYVTLPSRVVQLWQNQQIGNAHFADILRCALLCEYGGCWIDATIWMSDDIKEDVFEYPFYSCRFPDDGKYVTRNIWSNFFLAAQPQSVTMHFVRDVLYEYLKHQPRFVDYFMMDYIIRWGYDYIHSIKKELNAIPMNNESVHELVRKLHEPTESDEVQEIISRSYLHKLSWRIDVSQFAHGSIGYDILN